jgi:hypothetical protein
LSLIRDNDVIPSATGDGKIGLISTPDIAELAADALTDAKSHNKEYLMFGPELITYDQVCPSFANSSCFVMSSKADASPSIPGRRTSQRRPR